MKHNKINDNTRVRVRVPRKLYEAIQERMKQEEAREMEEGAQPASGSETKAKGYNTASKTNAVNRPKMQKPSKGDKAKAYQPVHSRVYKESEMEENALSEGGATEVFQQILGIIKDNWPMISAAGGILGLAKFLASNIKKQGADVSGSTGAGHGLEESDPPGVRPKPPIAGKKPLGPPPGVRPKPPIAGKSVHEELEESEEESRGSLVWRNGACYRGKTRTSIQRQYCNDKYNN